MIIILPIELFIGPETPDLDLLSIFWAGRRRYKIRLKPSYRPGERRDFETWLAQQSPHCQTDIRIVLDRGLTDWEFGTAREPSILVERNGDPRWPDSLDSGPVKLPVSKVTDFIAQPLQLVLENGRNDWGFLQKIVPTDWKNKWKQAVEAQWINSMGSGITEIRPLIRQLIALNDARRLRTWVMCDSDGRAPGHLSRQAMEARDECREWSIRHHILQRRAIENYIPKSTLFDWARRHPQADIRNAKNATVIAYWDMGSEQRHHYNVAEGFGKDLKSRAQLDNHTNAAISALYGARLDDKNGPLYSGVGGNPAQDIWGDNPDQDPYVISEVDIQAEQFENERAQIFQSIFAML